MAGILSQLFGGGAAQPVDQRPLIDRLSNVAGGNLSGELSTSDKLIALSQLMRSMTRSGQRAGLTPADVIQNLQTQKATELKNRMAVEQLRAAAEQKKKQTTIVNEYAGALEDPKQRMALMAVGPEKASEKIIEIAFRPRQVQQIMTDDSGNTRIVFGDGTSGMLDFKVERGRKWIQADPGNTGTTKLLLVDEKTGAPVLDDQGGYQTMAIGSNWAEQQRIAQGWENVSISRSNANTKAAEVGSPNMSQTSMKYVVGTDGKPVAKEVRYNKAKGSWEDILGKPVRLSAPPGSEVTKGIPYIQTSTPGTPLYGGK